MKKLTLLLPVSVLLLSACVVPGPAPVLHGSVPFADDEYKPYLASGTATIDGQAFLKTKAGDVKTAAADVVSLIPETSYTKERLSILKNKGDYQDLEEPDPRLKQYVRTTIGDAQGNFEFKNLPAGSYIITSKITWQYPSEYGLMTTGGLASAEISVKDGEVQKVIVTE